MKYEQCSPHLPHHHHPNLPFLHHFHLRYRMVLAGLNIRSKHQYSQRIYRSNDRLLRWWFSSLRHPRIDIDIFAFSLFLASRPSLGYQSAKLPLSSARSSPALGETSSAPHVSWTCTEQHLPSLATSSPLLCCGRSRVNILPN